MDGFKIKVSDVNQISNLMNKSDYDKFVTESVMTDNRNQEFIEDILDHHQKSKKMLAYLDRFTRQIYKKIVPENT